MAILRRKISQTGAKVAKTTQMSHVCKDLFFLMQTRLSKLAKSFLNISQRNPFRKGGGVSKKLRISKRLITFYFWESIFVKFSQYLFNHSLV